MDTGTLQRPPNCADRTCGLCFRCHVASVNISPAAMPTRYNTGPAGTRAFNNNSWERGLAVHESGMPYLDDKLDPIGLHEWQTVGGDYTRRFNAERAADATPPIVPAAPDPVAGA